MHPAGFRNGEWAELLTTVPAPETPGEMDRSCYLVRFPDGAEDFWVVGDPDGQYEFRTVGDDAYVDPGNFRSWPRGY